MKATASAIRLNLSLRINKAKIEARISALKAEKIISKVLFSTSKFNFAAILNQNAFWSNRKYKFKAAEPAINGIAKSLP